MATVQTTDDGGVRILTLDRPEALNAFSQQQFDDVTDAFNTAAGDDNVRVVVLTGAGRAFSAGADLAPPGDYASRGGFPAMLDAILDFPKPFIVAINGVGVGIGATITGLADLVYMSDQARLRCPFSALGITAEAASTLLFPLLMGRQRANWFLLSAEWLSAAECVEAGLALEVLPPDELMPRAVEQAHKLAALPAASLATTKRLLLDPVREQVRATFKVENDAIAGLKGGPANLEAVTAFREKRAPDFSGM